MGMFDTVFIYCPHCSMDTRVQSKAGDCVLNNFDQSSVPVEIAKDLNMKRPMKCEHCEGMFTVVMMYSPAEEKMRHVRSIKA